MSGESNVCRKRDFCWFFFLWFRLVYTKQWWRTNSFPSAYPGRGREGQLPSSLADKFFWKKVNFLKNLVFLGKKWDFAPSLNFFLILPPSEISPGYALGWTKLVQKLFNIKSSKLIVQIRFLELSIFQTSIFWTRNFKKMLKVVKIV